MKDQEPSGQTVREILETLWTKETPFGQQLQGLDEAEAAINQVIVSVLEELAAQQWSFGPNDDALAVPSRYIHAVIAKYKEGGNHE